MDIDIEQFLLNSENLNFSVNSQQNYDNINILLSSDNSDNIGQVTDLWNNTDLIYQIIIAKRENTIYKQRLKFIQNLLLNKKQEQEFKDFAKYNFIREIQKKDQEMKTKFNLEDEMFEEVSYALRSGPKSIFKTEKRQPRKNKKKANQSYK